MTNATWRAGNVVLVGDAAHTAHFSIGSGTKLAMEDSIALAHAVLAHAPDVTTALARYEEERRPVVERTQRVAQHSLEWFETTRRYVDLDPLELTFALLSRSKQITWENLRRRDPALVERLARGFRRRPSSARPRTASRRPPMFAACPRDAVRTASSSRRCACTLHEGVPGDLTSSTTAPARRRRRPRDGGDDGRLRDAHTPGCAGLWNDATATNAASSISSTARAAGSGSSSPTRKGSTRRMWEAWTARSPRATGPSRRLALPYLPDGQVPTG